MAVKKAKAKAKPRAFVEPKLMAYTVEIVLVGEVLNTPVEQLRAFCMATHGVQMARLVKAEPLPDQGVLQ